MSHQIYEEKFLSYRQPAWHKVGHVVDVQLTAVEAAQQIHLPEITVEPVVTASGIITNHKAIIGHLTAGPTVYSVVSNAYHELSHQRFLETWDRVVKQYVETIGLLQEGAGLFVSAALPDFEVKGDEIKAYILAENWLNGVRADKVRKTPVRVVCWNTLNLSDRHSVEELRFVHNKPVEAQLEQYLGDLIARSTEQYQALKEVFELLASTRVSDEQAQALLTNVYPDKPQPAHLLTRAATDRDALDQLAAWERSNGAQQEHRRGAFALYAGEGRGSQSPAAAGTLWGTYNAVAEYEQYLKKFRKAESVAFGAGADRVAEAFDLCLVAAGVKNTADL
jgi:phage/plasmid-like protein (TIGR03299 family)